MSNCTNKRLRDMLHHYELGLLSDKDREVVEEHLLDCEECFNSLTEFQNAAQHIVASQKVRDEISKLAGREEIVEEPGKQGKVPAPSRKLSSMFAPTFAIAAIVILLLVLKPWHIEFQPTREAIAAENRLVITHFENLTDAADSARLGEIVTSLLITDLTDSRHVQVVSSQRLHDIMHQLELDPQRPINQDIAMQVAKASRAKWVLTGNIIQIEPNLIVTFEIFESITGNVAAANRVTGENDETVFSLIDKISIEVREAMSLPVDAPDEIDRLVTDITTHSADAYRYYLEGLEYASKLYFPEAAVSFKRTLEYDSTFAMAYYHLARFYDASYITKALQYSSNTTRLEKYYIEAQFAYTNRDFDKTIEKLTRITEEFPDEKRAYFELGLMHYQLSHYEDCLRYTLNALEIDPSYKDALNQLAYAYEYLGDFENSILAIDRYINLAPDEANPYDTRGDLYAHNGYPDKALESYKKAVEIKPDFFASYRKMGNLYLYRGEFDKAEQCYMTILPTADSGYYLRRIYPGLIPYYKGKFQETLSMFDAIIQKQDSLGEDFGIMYVLRIKAFIYLQLGNYEYAIKILEHSIDVHDQIFPGEKANDRHILAQFYALSGNFEKAEQLATELQRDLAGDEKEIYRYWYAKGAIAFAQDRFDDAAAAFKETVAIKGDFPGDFMLGRSYLQLGNHEKAVELFEGALRNHEESLRLCFGTWNIKMHYYLGLAYEHSRWNEKAITQYEIFLKIWKDADPGIVEIEDAKKRLAALKKISL